VGDANNASSSGGTGADKDRQQQHPTLLLARDALMADAVAPAAPGPDTGAGLDGGPRRAASVAAHGDSRGSNDTPEGGAPASGASWPLLSWSRCRVAAAQIGRVSRWCAAACGERAWDTQRPPGCLAAPLATTAR
jgi:hypothetical protein